MIGEVTALAELFREVLPLTSVLADAAEIDHKYRRNVTALERQVPLVLLPASEDEVEHIVRLANECRIALYPFSTGKNWGLGSKLPVAGGCVLVDLSRMNQIVAVNEAFGYAIIEPGVTQVQLAAHLQRYYPDLTLNFTGSYGYTSIVGNVLERGDGAYARVGDLLGIRGYLGSGKPFTLGGIWRHMGSTLPSHHCKLTAGPDLRALFTHSSFGIVTQMAFRLIHRPKRLHVFWGIAPDANLERVVDALADLGRQGVINQESVNVGYANRFLQAAGALQEPADRRLGDASVWNLYVVVSGTARVADAIIAELQEALGGWCLSTGVLSAGLNANMPADLPAFLRPLVQPLMGSPDTESIKLIYGLTSTPLPSDPLEIDVDQTPFGMKCYVAVLPPDGEYVRRAANVAAAVSLQSRLDVKFSVFGDGRALMTIHFRTDNTDQVRRAELCESVLWDAMVAAGFPPYRVGIDQMARLVALDPELFDLVAQLKSVLDPNHIIAPGRYCPIERRLE